MENYGTQLLDHPFNNDTYKRSKTYYSGVLQQGSAVDFDPDNNSCLWDCRPTDNIVTETRRYDSYYSELMPAHGYGGYLEVTEMVNSASGGFGYVLERYIDTTYDSSKKNIEYFRKGYLPASAQGKFKTNSSEIQWLPWIQAHDLVGAYPQVLDLSYMMTTPGANLTGNFFSNMPPKFTMVVEQNHILLTGTWWATTKSSNVQWNPWTDGCNHRILLWDGTSTYSDTDLLYLCRNAVDQTWQRRFEVQHYGGTYSIHGVAELVNYNDSLAIYVNGFQCDHTGTLNYTQQIGCSVSWLIPK